MRAHFIIPTHILQSIAVNGDKRQREAAWATLTASEQFRGERKIMTALSPIAAAATGTRRRTIYDAHHGYVLPGKLVRGEGDPKRKDPAVNEAYDGAGATYDFLFRVFGRRSIDARGCRLDATVHYGMNYDNAFWNGRQMVYGDGTD